MTIVGSQTLPDFQAPWTTHTDMWFRRELSENPVYDHEESDLD